MTDKNLRINLVLSVFPAPLSPLQNKTHKLGLLITRRNKQKTKKRNETQCDPHPSSLSTEHLLGGGKTEVEMSVPRGKLKGSESSGHTVSGTCKGLCGVGGRG